MRGLIFAAILLLTACDADGQNASYQPGADGSWPTPAPNAPGQTPAFPGQTRAPAIHSSFALHEQVIATGLDHPWAIAFLPDGRMLVTERVGRMRIITPTGRMSAPLAGLPAVFTSNQGGLLDVVASPTFGSDRLIYWSYSEPRADGGRTNGTSVARARLSANDGSLENAQVIFRQEPAWRSAMHFGSRLAFDGHGHLFVTLGERSVPEARVHAQDLTADLGKVVRINADGSIPADNPFVHRADARPEIWSYGHRNVQGADINPATGELWTVEHGAQGGDEVNAPRAGRNYGWPIITYGEDYGGGPIGAGMTQHEGMEQPLYFWDPVIAPSGAHFYRGDLFPGWRGDLLIAALRGQALVRLTLDGEHVIGEERVLTDQGRLRDVAESADGALWVVTDDDHGKLIRVTPQ